jgi:ferric-dicitrate binding protein FerR (iron transport regulator)
VQQQLRTSAVRAREAWARASGKRPSKAVADKKLYTKIRESATSLTQAGRMLGRKPQPPKRRGRKLILLAAAGGTLVVVIRQRQEGSSPAGATGSAPPDA